MDEKIIMIAERIHGLRILQDISAEEMAKATDTTVEEFLDYESGKKDYSFTFLYRAANRLGVDITELITGEVPKLSLYCYVPAGEGFPIKRREGFQYQHMAYLFKDKAADPFVVSAKFESDHSEIPLSTHSGQEYDFVLEGQMRMKIEDHEFIMKKGDSVYYNARNRHGMAACGGKDCSFLAVIIKHEDGEKN